MKQLAEKLVKDTLTQAGVTINGGAPWDIRVHNPRFYGRIITGGSVGFGEAYMDGDWDTGALDALIQRIIRRRVNGSRVVTLNRLFHDFKSRVVNQQTRRGARAMAENHYDLDHRLYRQFLGPYNQYSCCFFNRARTLAEAELEKLEMICDKLDLQPGEKVLDIGCGWGGFARYAAQTRGCEVTGVNISKEQISIARRFNDGLPVEIVDSDYRDLPQRLGTGSFDKMVSVGMIEHVGYRNYRQFFEIAHSLLRDQGIFLLHTIGSSTTTTVTDPWIEKYIFRNSMLPSMAQLATATERLFVVQDWENYGHYYVRTLLAWQENFERNWAAIAAIDAKPQFDERFRRMFNYYFLSCKAAFEAEHIFLWHLVMTKSGEGQDVYPRVNLVSGCGRGDQAERTTASSQG